MTDWLEWFPLLLWLPVSVVFVLLAAAAWLAPRSLRVHLRMGWTRHTPPARPRLRPLLAAGLATLAAVVLFGASAGEALPVRLAAGLSGAVVAWLVADFSWRAVRDSALRRSALAREWQVRTQQALAELACILEQDDPALAVCRILQNHLRCGRVLWYEAAEEGFRRKAACPPAEAEAPLWPRAGALAAALVLRPSGLPLPLAAPGNRVRLPAVAAAAETSLEEAQLESLGAVLAVPLVRGGALDGFFLLGAPEGGDVYGPHHFAFLEKFCLAAQLMLASAAAAAEIARKAEAEARAQARHAAIRLALSALQPPDPVELPDLDCAGVADNRDECRVFFDSIPLPGRAAAFAAVEMEAGFEEAAIRLVQLQALLRTRARAYHEDLAELAASTRRALEAPGAGWPRVRLFLALYRCGERRLHYINAGFLPPFLFRRTMEGAQVLRLRHTGPPLAAEDSFRCEEAETEFAPGDLLLAVSSTVPAAVNADGEAWGELRLIDSLNGWSPAPARQLLDQARNAWENFVAPPARRPPSLFLILRPKA